MIPCFCRMVVEAIYIDLGAERVLFAAERGEQKIAIETKSFLGVSPLHDLQEAVGQYQVYRTVLGEIAPERQLYLAVPQRVHEGILTERFGQLILRSLHLCLIVFNEQQERILLWIP